MSSITPKTKTSISNSGNISTLKSSSPSKSSDAPLNSKVSVSPATKTVLSKAASKKLQQPTSSVLLVPKGSTNASTLTPTISKFYFACRNNDIDTVKTLLPMITLDEIDQFEPNGSTALHAASYYGHDEIVELLLAYGARRMLKNKHNCTPLDEAKTDTIRKLFQRADAVAGTEINRFSATKGPSLEWIFVKGHPTSYASFNRKSLLNCRTDDEFERLCSGVQKQYVNVDGPLSDVKNIDQVRRFIDRALEEHDPTYVVRAYTAETGFYHRLNTDLAQLPTHWSGIKHERNIASIMIYHPVFEPFSYCGETYRGMLVSPEDLADYVVGSVFMNKTFLSTAKERHRAESFVRPSTYPKKDLTVGVICKYTIKGARTALTIEKLSEYPEEKEVLILPYASFKVKDLRQSRKYDMTITEIDVEEEEPIQWTLKSCSHSSQTHMSVTMSTTNDNGSGIYAKMFKDSQEKGKIDAADLSKWEQESFGIDQTKSTYAKIWNDAKKGKISKSDIAKWKKEAGVVTTGDNQNDSDLESYDGENHSNIFTASNHQSYTTSKTFTSKQSFNLNEFLQKFQNDHDSDN